MSEYTDTEQGRREGASMCVMYLFGVAGRYREMDQSDSAQNLEDIIRAMKRALNIEGVQL